jgi:tellurite resistance protein TerC
VLVVTIAASLLSPRGRAQQSVASLRHPAQNYLDIDHEVDQQMRAASDQGLLDEEARVKALPEKYRRYIPEEEKLVEQLRTAHDRHDRRVRMQS